MGRSETEVDAAKGAGSTLPLLLMRDWKEAMTVEDSRAD